MDLNENNFKNVINPTNKNKFRGNFKQNILVPFLSGVVGCTLVVGTCFGVPEIRNKIIGSRKLI